MKTLFVTSLACAFVSLLTVISFSAITIIPGPWAESFRTDAMLVAGAFFAAWLSLALGVRGRRRAVLRPAPPQWLTWLLVFLSVIYFLAILFSVIA